MVRDSLLLSSAGARGEETPASFVVGALSLWLCLEGAWGAKQEFMAQWAGGGESPAVGSPFGRPLSCSSPRSERVRWWCVSAPEIPVLTLGGEIGREGEALWGADGVVPKGLVVGSPREKEPLEPR